MLRVSATTLEKFRRYMDDASSFDTEEALIESLKGLFLGNPKTRAGAAFHSIIEDPSKPVFDAIMNRYWVDGIPFTPAQFDVAKNYRADHPVMIHEVPVFKVYDIGTMEIMISARVDGIEGREVRDAKTKFRAPAFSEYIDSAQWKIYLDILGLDVFYYDIFEVKGFDDEKGVTEKTTFIYHEPLRCTRYINLNKDCLQLIKDFMNYIEAKNFYHLLKQAREYELAMC